MLDPTHPSAAMCGSPVDLVTGRQGQIANASLVANRTPIDLEVLPIAAGVWSVVGLSVANTHLIDAPDGVIVVDSGRSDDDGRVLRRLIAETIGRPIAAVVYTHSHYVGGTATLLGDDAAEVIAHPNCHQRYRQQLASIGPALKHRGQAQYGVALPSEGPDADPIGTATGRRGAPAYRAPTRVVPDGGGLITIAGERVQVYTDHVFDCDANLTLVFPDRGVACHNLLTRGFPSMVSIAGGRFRDPTPWLAGLDDLRQHELIALLGCHGLPVLGDEACATALRQFRDALQFTHDQTVRGANAGLTADEIVDALRLPGHLAGDPDLSAHYADWVWGVRAVWAGRLGWYSGRAEDLAPVPQRVEAEKIVGAYGGVAAALTAAQADAEHGERAWAARLLRLVLRLEPDNEAARQALADCLRGMGHRASAWTARNAYLVQANELEGTLDRRDRPYRIGPDTAAEVDSQSLVEVLRFRVDPLRAQPANLVVAIDLGEGPVAAHLRQGVLEVGPAVTGSPQLSLHTTRAAWTAWLDGEASVADLMAAATATPAAEHPDWRVWWWAFDGASPA